MGVNSMNYSNEEFMNEVAKYAKKYAPKYGISLSAISAIVAQACLESGYGKSELAKYHNFFGLKYREGRVACHDGTYNMDTKEQLKDNVQYWEEAEEIFRTKRPSNFIKKSLFIVKVFPVLSSITVK